MSILNSVGVRELRQNASKLLDRVKAGESYEITEHGKPVAMLIPLPESEYEKAIAAKLFNPPLDPDPSFTNFKTVKSILPGSSLDRLLADRAAD